MWTHEKQLLYPLGKLSPNPEAAKLISRLLAGECQSALCYLSQSYTMPYDECRALLVDIGTEELGHFELLAQMFRKLTRNLSAEDLRGAGLSEYYIDHTLGIASPRPISFGSIGDPIADLHQCLLLEQSARTSIDNVLRLIDDAGVQDALLFLRERELAHCRLFTEMLERVKICMNGQGCYAYNPAFDLCTLNQSEED